MDLFTNVNTAGKPFLVYIDGEFQTYRVPSQNDPLKAEDYIKTPYHYGMEKGNFGNNKYHFLLNLAFIIIGPDGLRSGFAMFPSKFECGDAGFENPQLLEPDYAPCNPDASYKITEERKIIGEKGTFPYYADFSEDPEKKAAFENINRIYNSSISIPEFMESYATLSYLISIAPYAMIVHKGQNDLYALSNTARLFGLEMKPITTRDLDRVILHLPDLRRTKLDIVQAYFTAPPSLPNNVENADPVHIRLHSIKDKLIAIRETMLGEIRAFFISKWGPRAGNIAAHNPLVDCVYAIIMDLGLGSSADVAISVFDTDLAAAE
jgi:hypothetical protein